MMRKRAYDLLLLRSICERIARMKDTQIIHVLDIAFAKVKRDGILLRQEMKRIKCLCLRFSDGWNGGRSRKAPIAGERSTGVLDDYALRVRRCLGSVMN